jgi:alpha-beta hydrolase superfamily lysophospholipase
VGDVFSDISADLVAVEMLGVSGYVHTGIVAAATFVHMNTQAALKRAAEEVPGWPLLIVGHSLGGALADADAPCRIPSAACAAC